MPVAITIVAGFTLSTVAFFYAWDRTRKAVEAEFRIAAGDRVNAVRNAIDEIVLVMESLGSFYRGSETVTRVEFAEYVKPFLSRVAGAEVLAWIPRVPREQREQYETAARREGLAGFRFNERDKSQRTVPAGDRAEYFPIYMVEPSPGNEALFGFDLGSDADRCEALERARETGQPVAIRPAPIEEEWRRSPPIRIVLPVYIAGRGVPQVTGRREDLRGFVAGYFRIGKVLEKTLSRRSGGGIDIYVYDKMLPTPENLIGSHASRARRTPAEPGDREASEMEYSAAVGVGNQRWLIRCMATKEFFAWRIAALPWDTLAVGLLVTGLVAGWLQRQTGQAARIQRLVDERTTRLAESESRFRAITTSAQDAIILIDDRGNISFWNEAATRIFGYTEEEARGRNVHELLAAAEDLARSREAFPGFQQSGSGAVIGKTVVGAAVKKGGEVFPVELSISAVKIENRWHATAVVRDISERQRGDALRKRIEMELAKAREAAESATRAKSQFLAKMSHELRTPMSSIIGFTGRLLKKLGPSLPEPELDALRTVDRNAWHLLMLINEILDISKIESGKMQLSRSPFDLVGAIREVGAQMTPLAEAKPLALNLQLPAGPVIVDADRTKIVQVVTNLVSNGIKYTRHGSVTVSVAEVQDEQLGRSVRIAVRDTGIGISADDQRRLFQEFTQIDGVARPCVGGSGLGLFIVRQFVEMHGGRVGLRSAPGEGSEFAVVLPLARTGSAGNAGGLRPDALAEANPGPAPEHRDACPDGLKILCVDDEPDILKYMYLTFRDAGYTVLLADDCESAIAQSRSERPDLIFLDLRLPGKDGYEVLKALRSDPSLASTPVVVVSVSDERAKAITAGARCYLIKPVGAENLLTTVRDVLASEIREALVVDDDPDTQRLLASHLAAHGIAVRTATDGLDALGKLVESTPSVILLDLGMPVMDGLEFLRHIQSDPVWNEIPVVILTGKALSPEEVARLSSVSQAILTKGRDDTEDFVDTVLKAVLHGKSNQPERPRCDRSSSSKTTPTA